MNEWAVPSKTEIQPLMISFHRWYQYIIQNQLIATARINTKEEERISNQWSIIIIIINNNKPSFHEWRSHRWDIMVRNTTIRIGKNMSYWVWSLLGYWALHWLISNRGGLDSLHGGILMLSVSIRIIIIIITVVLLRCK